MRKMLFTANDIKRLKMIEEKSPYANTIWLISKIKALVWELSKTRKELDAALSYSNELQDRKPRSKS